ncbi:MULTISPECIES: DUF1294 domain-containing protein [Glaesserella]|uniref:DUF1294 domain-containing protein n=1 Tax=Glaesserella australis TaxID=2094024 RepID=A0A328BZA2_9PAST|nr:MULTISPECIES: DUF1294 domain-containing protein [Glaesserella]AUI65741.1 hypothetical protein CJD39_03740 [Glaesserella sp. 15-184]RAL18975.1 DUF1294 domain-containing protein [Glaesserella australis]
MLIYILIYLVLINLLSAYLMYQDKQKAIQKAWREPESNLLFLCFCGGFMGTYLVMKYARHKTKHWQFHLSVIVSTLLWVVGLPILYWYIKTY